MDPEDKEALLTLREMKKYTFHTKGRRGGDLESTEDIMEQVGGNGLQLAEAELENCGCVTLQEEKRAWETNSMAKETGILRNRGGGDGLVLRVKIWVSQRKLGVVSVYVPRSCCPSSLTFASGSNNLSQKIKWGFPKADNRCWHLASTSACMYMFICSHTHASTQPHEHVHMSYIQIKLERKKKIVLRLEVSGRTRSRKSTPLSSLDG